MLELGAHVVSSFSSDVTDDVPEDTTVPLVQLIALVAIL
jgi:hypothetical protein